jgi:hypothetical protein
VISTARFRNDVVQGGDFQRQVDVAVLAPSAIALPNVPFCEAHPHRREALAVLAPHVSGKHANDAGQPPALVRGTDLQIIVVLYHLSLSADHIGHGTHPIGLVKRFPCSAEDHHLMTLQFGIHLLRSSS